MSGSVVLYAYGIVEREGRSADVSAAPRGVEDAAVSLVEHGSVAALVSRLPADVYAPERVEEQSGNVEWLAPRALAHDRVLTWAQERDGVIPLPMFSMWGSEPALARTLEERRALLTQTFERIHGADEFGLRVHRVDDVMRSGTVLDEIDPEIASLRAAAAAATPGQRYLLERKVAESSTRALRAAGQRLARAVFEELRPHAREVIARPLTPRPAASAAETASLVLNAAFLVDRTRLDVFRAAVGACVARDEPRGLRFDFTGPWPPYHFVGEAGAAPRGAAAGRSAHGESR